LTDAETCATGPEPERNIPGVLASSSGLERILDGRLAEVPLLSVVVLLEIPQQLRHVDVVVVVEMAPPFFAALKIGVELGSHFAAQRPPVVG